MTMKRELFKEVRLLVSAALVVAGIPVSSPVIADTANPSVRVLSLTEARATTVALSHRAAKRCHGDCYVIISSDERLCRITIANRKQVSGFSEGAFRYFNGVEILVDKNSNKVISVSDVR